MKKIIRAITGTLLIFVGIFFACIAISLLFQGQKLHLVLGAFCGALAFITSGAMTISGQTWRRIFELLVAF